MVAFLIAVAVATGVAWVGWFVDLRLTDKPVTARRALALLLLGASAWLITLVQAAHAFQIPGAYGPVQYWTDADGNVSGFFFVRVLAMFVVLGCTLAGVAVGIRALAALSSPASIPNWRFYVIPAVALLGFAVAVHLVVSRGFVPTV